MPVDNHASDYETKNMQYFSQNLLEV